MLVCENMQDAQARAFTIKETICVFQQKRLPVKRVKQLQNYNLQKEQQITMGLTEHGNAVLLQSFLNG